MKKFKKLERVNGAFKVDYIDNSKAKNATSYNDKYDTRMRMVEFGIREIEEILALNIKKGSNLAKKLKKLDKLLKKERIYIWTDNKKIVRVIIGRYIYETRCNPTDTFVFSRGATMCIAGILRNYEKKSASSLFTGLDRDDLIRLMVNGTTDFYLKKDEAMHDEYMKGVTSDIMEMLEDK